MRVSFEDWLQRPTPVSLIRPSLTRRRCQRSKYSHGLTPLSRTCLLETQTKSRRFSSVLSSLPRSKLAAEGSSAADGLGCKCHNNHKRCKSDRAKGLPPNSLVPEFLYWQSKGTFIVKTRFYGMACCLYSQTSRHSVVSMAYHMSANWHVVQDLNKLSVQVSADEIHCSDRGEFLE